MDELKMDWDSIRNATEEERQEYYINLANQQTNVDSDKIQEFIYPNLQAYFAFTV